VTVTAALADLDVRTAMIDDVERRGRGLGSRYPEQQKGADKAARDTVQATIHQCADGQQIR
jgi:hypothetical protein